MLAIGSEIQFRALFSDLAGVLTDPTTISLKVRPPGGSQSTYTYAAAQITKESVGIYKMRLSVTVAGEWAWRWECGGVLVGATVDQQFRVYATSFT